MIQMNANIEFFLSEKNNEKVIFSFIYFYNFGSYCILVFRITYKINNIHDRPK